jgi:hypothetical protein
LKKSLPAGRQGSSQRCVEESLVGRSFIISPKKILKSMCKVIFLKHKTKIECFPTGFFLQDSIGRMIISKKLEILERKKEIVADSGTKVFGYCYRVALSSESEDVFNKDQLNEVKNFLNKKGFGMLPAKRKFKFSVGQIITLTEAGLLC